MWRGAASALFKPLGKATAQTVERICSTVHLIRHGLNLCFGKDRKAAAAGLRRIWRATTVHRAAAKLDRARPPPRMGRGDPVLRLPALRKIICTMNAVKNLNRVIRKSIKARGSFPAGAVATRLICLPIRSFEKDGLNVRKWFVARDRFAMMFAGRLGA